MYFFLSVYCISHLVSSLDSAKPGCLAFKELQKIEDNKLFFARSVTKSGDWLNENLNQETIYRDIQYFC